MRLVYATTCRGRAHHLAKTLPRNVADNPNAHFVVLNYGSQDNLMELARDYVGSGSRVTFYTLPNPGVFRMAHAKNMAHRLGILEGADVLCNLDADNYTGPGFDDYILEHITPDTFLWAKMIPGVLTRGISGRIVLPTQMFLKAGGYDERYAEWGPDDKDLTARLTRLGFEGAQIDPAFLKGIKHDDRVRFREYQQARSQIERYGDPEIDTDARVVNAGKIGCGVVTRNYDRLPITLHPLPTRIFGIGLHKTGTTSLANALNRLGIDCAHWVTPRWARDIYEEVTQEGRSKTLERSYALCDLPIPMLYRELDRAYPGSKFILTNRKELDWIASVERHWSEANPYRGTWYGDSFTRKVHSMLYGRGDFDRETMLARYRRHNREVHEYFVNRPHDLLDLSLDQPHPWHTLSAFLGQLTPSEPWPHENRTVAPEAALKPL